MSEERDAKTGQRAAVVRELQSALKVLLALTVAAALGVTVVTLNIIVDGQRSGHQTLQQVKQDSQNTQNILNFIADCTSPQGTCAKLRAAVTAGTVQSVEDIVVFAAVCAKQPTNTTVVQIRDCVEKGIKK